MARTWREVARALADAAVREAPNVLRQVQRRLPSPGSPARGKGATVPARPGLAGPKVSRGRGRQDTGNRSTSGRDRTDGAGRHLVYAPQLDGRADPGEVVWTWVRYEDQPDQGEDRPVLVVGREGATLLGLMLSSQHERDGQRNWLALGAGAWDREARPSWVRLDRVLEVPEDGIRREGAVLERTRFDAVAAALRSGYGWR